MTREELLLRIWGLIGTEYTMHWLGPGEHATRFAISVTEDIGSISPESPADGLEMTMRARRIFCVFGESLEEVVEKALLRTVRFIGENKSQLEKYHPARFKQVRALADQAFAGAVSH